MVGLNSGLLVVDDGSCCGVNLFRGGCSWFLVVAIRSIRGGPWWLLFFLGNDAGGE